MGTAKLLAAANFMLITAGSALGSVDSVELPLVLQDTAKVHAIRDVFSPTMSSFDSGRKLTCRENLVTVAFEQMGRHRQQSVIAQKNGLPAIYPDLPDTLTPDFRAIPPARLVAVKEDINAAYSEFRNANEAGDHGLPPFLSPHHSLSDESTMAVAITNYEDDPGVRRVRALLVNFYLTNLNDFLETLRGRKRGEVPFNFSNSLETILGEMDPRLLRVWNEVVSYAEGEVPYFDKGMFELAALEMVHHCVAIFSGFRRSKSVLN